MFDNKLLKKFKKEFSGKKVLIMGLGVHGGGTASAKFFARAGADVTVTDLKPKSELGKSLNKLRGYKIKYVLGSHRPEDFWKADLIVKNPGVNRNSSFLKIARRHGVKVTNDAEIFLRFAPGRVIGVTGSKGKTTVANLLFKMLKNRFKNVRLAGVKQKGGLEEITIMKPRDKIVVELSSWQLEELRKLKKSPPVSILTNILGDHLDTYKNIKEYAEVKAEIFKHQKKNDLAVFNADDERSVNLSRKAPGKIIFYSARKKNQSGAWIDKDNFIVFGKKPVKIAAVASIKLKGDHNLSNVLAAVTAAIYLKVPVKSIIGALGRFKGLKNKLEIIGQKKGITFINDTDATMPAAAGAAIAAIGRDHPIILIGGGTDKKLDFSPLIKAVKSGNVKAVVLLPGTATSKIFKKIKRGRKPIILVSSMPEAVAKAVSCAEKEDIVLLSPGAASFGLFRNAGERGEEFKKAFKLLGN